MRQSFQAFFPSPSACTMWFSESGFPFRPIFLFSSARNPSRWAPGLRRTKAGISTLSQHPRTNSGRPETTPAEMKGKGAALLPVTTGGVQDPDEFSSSVELVNLDTDLNNKSSPAALPSPPRWSRVHLPQVLHQSAWAEA